MAQAQSNNAGKNSTAAEEVKSAVFHDFLGKGCAPDLSPAVPGSVRVGAETSPSASASLGASSGGGRCAVSTTSDLGSERQVGNHFEGVPFYGPRGEFTGPETNNRYVGTKRSNSDSVMGSSRDKYPSVRPESMESSHLMKLLRNAGGERPRRPHDEETSFGVHPLRPTSASFISQAGSRPDTNASKWDRAIPINTGPTLQYPPRAGQIVPLGYQVSTNRLRDSNAGPLAISQAADEGSRTGIKGSGILSSINASEKNFGGVLPSSSKHKSLIHMSEPESSTIPNRRGLPTSGCQMTIFYGGQAHVFDDVHPNKADIIMALAGSNGGSWSTTYAPKSATRLSTGETCAPSSENDKSLALQRELQGRASAGGNSSHGFGSGDLISKPPGIHPGSAITIEGKAPIHAVEAEPSSDKK